MLPVHHTPASVLKVSKVRPPILRPLGLAPSGVLLRHRSARSSEATTGSGVAMTCLP